MRVFITGLTGTLGTALAKLHAERGDEVVGCARGEANAAAWLREHGHLGKLLIGDAADAGDWQTPVGGALLMSDRVYHCAAMKHVDLCEANVTEAVHQNVEVTRRVATACARSGTPLVFVSSDKACLPGGVYGATKLIGERLVIGMGGAAVRLGNLLGSSGSVFHVWRRQAEAGGPIKVTDPSMTRYFMRVSDAAAFVADGHVPRQVRMPYGMRAAHLGYMASAISLKYGVGTEVVGRRPGETGHQWLVAPDERYTHEDGAIVLGGASGSIGISSEAGPWWGADELLEAVA